MATRVLSGPKTLGGSKQGIAGLMGRLGGPRGWVWGLPCVVRVAIAINVPPKSHLSNIWQLRTLHFNERSEKFGGKAHPAGLYADKTLATL